MLFFFSEEDLSPWSSRITASFLHTVLPQTSLVTPVGVLVAMTLTPGEGSLTCAKIIAAIYTTIEQFISAGYRPLGVLFTSLGPILSKVSTVLTSLNRCISMRQMYRRNLQRSSFVCTSKNMEVCWHSQGARVCDKIILLPQATVSSISTYRFSSNSLIKRRWRVRLVSLPHKNQKHNNSDDAPTSYPEFSFLLTSRWLDWD